MKYEFTIFGFGISAKITSCLLARNGFSVCLISDKDQKQEISNTNLVTFLSRGSLNYLSSIFPNIKLFEEHSVPKSIDYLSMDIHPPFATCKVLEKIPFNKYKFKFITFETDSHRDERTREFSRNILESLGYKIITSDIQEDWYINDNFN